MGELAGVVVGESCMQHSNGGKWGTCMITKEVLKVGRGACSMDRRRACRRDLKIGAGWNVGGWHRDV